MASESREGCNGHLVRVNHRADLVRKGGGYRIGEPGHALLNSTRSPRRCVRNLTDNSLRIVYNPPRTRW